MGVPLPWILAPGKGGGSGKTSAAFPDVTGSVGLDPLVARPGTPTRVLEACRSALAAAAAPLGATRIEVASAGRATRRRGGGLAAPIETRIVYAHQGGVEVRQAEVTCQLDASGRVVAAS